MVSRAKSAVHLTIMALAVAVALAGCGGSSLAPFTKAGPPPNADCMKKWNGDEAALQLGKHFYAQGHDSRAAHVAKLDIKNQGVVNACLVVMAARDSDREYGTIGMYTDPTGVWQLINNLPVGSEQELLAVQQSGSKQANAELKEDGTVVPF